MNVKHTLLLLILVSLFSQAFGQEEVKYIKRYHKQKAWFSIQFDYSHHNVNFVEDIRGDIAFAKAPGVFRHSSIGVALRIPVWRFIYVQPEVLYGLSTNWEEAAVQTGFFSQMAYAFKNRNASILQVPFHIGCRWEPADLFAAWASVSNTPGSGCGFCQNFSRSQFFTPTISISTQHDSYLEALLVAIGQTLQPQPHHLWS